MTDKNLRSQLQVGELGERASSAASALLGKATLATAPDLRHVAVARRLSVVAALAALALVVGGIFALSLFASGALPWIVGTVLVMAVAGVIVLGLHAGGHGWFVPLPVMVLAGTWALVVSAGKMCIRDRDRGPPEPSARGEGTEADVVQQAVRPGGDDADLARDDEHPEGRQESPRDEADGPGVAPRKAECPGEPAEGEPRQHERHP